MTDLTHWHAPDKVTPPTHTEPPKCCTAKFRTVAEGTAMFHDARLTDAVRAERVRIVTEALAAIDVYRDAAQSVLDDPQLRLVVDRATEKCADAIRKVGCICPQIEVTRFGDTKPRFVSGRDHRCGLHDRDEATND